MMKPGVLVLALLLLPAASATVGQEDYERYPAPPNYYFPIPPGTGPSIPGFYTSVVGGTSGGVWITTVNSDEPPDLTGKRITMNAPSTPSLSMTMDNPVQSQYINFSTTVTTGGTFCIGQVGLSCTPAQTANRIALLDESTSGSTCNHRALNSAGSAIATPYSGNTGTPGSCSVSWHVEFNWAAKTYRVKINGGAFTSALPFHDNTVAVFGHMAVVSCPSVCAMNFDNFEVEGAGIAAAPFLEEPTEFDSGLLAFISDMGFVTPESQFFFSLILVGVVTVLGGVTLKFMAPGRMKATIVVASASLVGVFCVILGMFDLWMFVLAIVLGGAMVKGSSEWRNTWQEVRQGLSQLGRSAQTVTDDGAAVEPKVLFAIPSNPQGVVERQESVTPPEGEAGGS